MNLRGLANAATRAVNPNIAAVWRKCTGYAMNANRIMSPVYEAPVDIIVQAQALSKKEIEHLDALNLSNATRAVYANVQMSGIDREAQSGGDQLTFTDPDTGRASVWDVIAVLEGWGTSGWCKVAIAKQLT